MWKRRAVGGRLEAELAAFREGLADLGLSYDQLMSCLGGSCYDVYLSDRAYWRCVPARVAGTHALNINSPLRDWRRRHE